SLAPDTPASHGLLRRHAADEAPELGVAQHRAADGPPRQQRRPRHDALLAVEEDGERARQAAHEALLALVAVVGDEAVERDLAAEGELRLLGVPEVVEEPLRLAGGLLHAVEERRQPRLPSLEALAAEDGERHEEHGPAARLRRAHRVAQVLRPEARRGERA